MHKRGYYGVLYMQEPNFAWLTAGGSDPVEHTNEAGRAFGNILVTPERVYLLANNIEMPRISAEEIPPDLFEPLAYSWIDEEPELVVRRIVGRKPVASDSRIDGVVYEKERLSALRSPLVPTEIDRFRNLCADTAEAMNAAIAAVEPGMTETQIGAAAGFELLARGAFPTLILVGTDERIFRFRHPLPTEKRLDSYCMVVVCAQRKGLVSSMTRLVHFGPLPAEVADKYRSVQRVDVELAAATASGASLAEVFEAARRAYRTEGFPGEERRHFQGGTCGYYSREQDLTPDSAYRIHETEVFAHNPSITGVKIEDTMLLENGSCSVLTDIRDWPSAEIAAGGLTLSRPEILVR